MSDNKKSGAARPARKKPRAKTAHHSSQGAGDYQDPQTQQLGSQELREGSSGSEEPHADSGRTARRTNDDGYGRNEDKQRDDDEGRAQENSQARGQEDWDRDRRDVRHQSRSGGSETRYSNRHHRDQYREDRYRGERDRDRYREDSNDRYRDDDDFRGNRQQYDEAPRADRSTMERRLGDEPRDDSAEERREEKVSRPCDEYLLQVYFDKGAKAFIGTVLEFPEIKSSGNSREGVLQDLENKVNNTLENLKRRQEVLPEGYFNRRQPEKVEVKLSQGLFRRLEILAQAEKVGVEQLLPELIAAAMERRTEKRPEPQRQPQPSRDRDHRGNQRHSGQRHGGRNRNFHETMDSRENFMEYVRNLEKGNWRKK